MNKTKSLINPNDNEELILTEHSAVLKMNGSVWTTIDISKLSPNGYEPFSPWPKPAFGEWNLIKILSAIHTIEDLQWEKQKRYNIFSSYYLKHVIERQLFYQNYTELLGDKCFHLSNGEMIVAMLLLGFRMKKPNSINVYFNVEKRFFKKEYHYFETK